MGEIAEIRSRALQKTAAIYAKRRQKAVLVIEAERKTLGKIETQLVDFERQYRSLGERLDDRHTRRALLLEELHKAETQLHAVVEASHAEYNAARHKLSTFQSRRAIESNLVSRGFSMGSRARGSTSKHNDPSHPEHVRSSGVPFLSFGRETLFASRRPRTHIWRRRASRR